MHVLNNEESARASAAILLALAMIDTFAEAGFDVDISEEERAQLLAIAERLVPVRA